MKTKDHIKRARRILQKWKVPKEYHRRIIEFGCRVALKSWKPTFKKMKKILLIAFIALICSNCSNEGTIHRQSTNPIRINGKDYKFIEITPYRGANAVWVLVPVDSSVEMPTSISQDVYCGKNCRRLLTTIIVQ